MQNGFYSHKNNLGQALAEYGLLIALLALVCIGSLTVLGQSLSGLFSQAGSQIALNIPASNPNSPASGGTPATAPAATVALVTQTGNLSPSNTPATAPAATVALVTQTGNLSPSFITRLSPTGIASTATDNASHSSAKSPVKAPVP